MQNYDALIKRIAEGAALEVSEVERRVEAKKAKLSGLISKEGAAQIIAAELGVSFENQTLKLSELMPGMRKVNVVGKIVTIFPVREYERNGRKGKVVNFFMADETNNAKVVLWDTNHIALIEEGKIRKGDVVEIKNGGMRDQEIHLSGFSELRKSNVLIENVKTERQVVEKKLVEIQEGQSVRIRGLVVQMFNPRFYPVCPECGKKVTPDASGYICVEHGKIVPKERAILNLVLDDGEESVRTVLFSDQISQLIPEEDLKDADKLNAFRDSIMGTEVFVSGNVKKNQLFNNVEIVVNQVEKVDVEKLIEMLEKSS